ncbi:hypothetical protein NIES3974_42780 [Calothrix sp. NIES-3974]|nr:hypothetical protein NIES3974_42780 [Calothrix sp. NIES-3974]
MGRHKKNHPLDREWLSQWFKNFEWLNLGQFSTIPNTVQLDLKA